MEQLEHTAGGELVSKDPYIRVGAKFEVLTGNYRGRVLRVTTRCAKETEHLRTIYSVGDSYYYHVYLASEDVGDAGYTGHWYRNHLKLVE